MANFRYINTWIWKDPWFVDLRQSEQHLFLYLLTSPHTNTLGVYEISIREIAFDTGIDQEEVKRIFRDRFAFDGKVHYELGWVIMHNWLKHQTLNPNQSTGARKLYEGLPEWLRNRLSDPLDDLFIPYAKFNKAFESLTQGLPKALKPLPTKEKKRKESNINKTSSYEEGSPPSDAEPPDQKALAPIEEFGDKQINLIVKHFESKMGKMPRAINQRRAARTLIQRHGFEKVIGGINAVAASRGEQYAPSISSLVTLRDKWLDLETFYKRTQRQGESKVMVIS